MDFSPRDFHVLVVDDDEINLEFIQRRMTEREYNVSTAKNGEEAIEAIIKNPTLYELILMDVVMPVLDGMAALKIIRDSFTTRELPIIMVTATGGSDTVVHALNSGANDYVSKPIDFTVLFSRLEAHLRLSTNLRNIDVQEASLCPIEVEERFMEPLNELNDLVQTLCQSQRIKDNLELVPVFESIEETLKKAAQILNSEEEDWEVPEGPDSDALLNGTN